MLISFLDYQAICFVAFLIGFITVLCIGNYFRAKRSQERQRQRREAKQASQNNSTASKMEQGVGGKAGGEYEAPTLPQGTGASGRLL